MGKSGKAQADKTQVRTCCSCGKTGSKLSFVRFVRTPEGVVELDPTGKKSGRGAYLCIDGNCFLKARKLRRLDKALRISLDDDDYVRLEQEFLLRVSLKTAGEGTVS